MIWNMLSFFTTCITENWLNVVLQMNYKLDVVLANSFLKKI